MQYIYKINSLNSIVNTIPASSTEEEYLTSYGTTLYDNISKNCSSSSCYKIIDTLTLTDSQISNYCASGVAVLELPFILASIVALSVPFCFLK